MNLSKKKKLAAKVLKVGRDRIKFNQDRLDEIKEAITNQDMRDLVKDKAIIVKPKKGRKSVVKRKHKRGAGKVKKKVKKRKLNYVKLTRKLREYLKTLKRTGKISAEDYKKVRTKVRAKTFRSKSHLMEVLKT